MSNVHTLSAQNITAIQNIVAYSGASIPDIMKDAADGKEVNEELLMVVTKLHLLKQMLAFQERK